MKHKIILFTILIVLLSSLVTADLTDNQQTIYTIDDADVDSSTVIDLIGVSNATAVGTGLGRTAISNQGIETGEGTKYMTIPAGTFTNAETVSFWFRPNVTNCHTGATQISGLMVDDGAGGDFQVLIDNIPWYGGQYDLVWLSTGNLYEIHSDASNWAAGTWYNVVLLTNATGRFMFIDGVKQADSDPENGALTQTNDIWVGSWNGAAADRDCEAVFDEIYVWNTSLTDADITNLYNGGSGTFYPFTPVADKHYIPQITKEDQVTTISVNTSTYTNVLSGTIESLNNSNISVGVTGWVTGQGADSIANCEIEFNGTQIGMTTTTSPNEGIRSFYINTELDFVDIGNHTFNLNCKKDGSNKFKIDNSKMMITQFVNTDGDNVKAQETTITGTITGTEYVKIGDMNFTTTAIVPAADLDKTIIVKVGTNINYTSTGTICTVLSIDGINSTEYCRYGEAGSTGSGSMFEMEESVADSTDINVAIYAKSTTSDGYIEENVITFEIIEDLEETNSTALNNLNITSDTYTTIKSLGLENDDHLSETFIIEAGFSVKSNEATSTSRYRMTLSGDSTDTGTEIIKDVESVDQEGLVTIQETFDGLPVGNYTVNLQARANNSNMTITGGELIVYTGNAVDFLANGFNITAYNVWNDTTITEFNVTQNGNVYTTNESLVFVATEDDTVNFTISSEGYFDETYTDYNTSNALNQSMKQSDIKFTAFSGVSGTYLVSNFTIDSTTQNENVSFYLSEGTHSVTTQSDGYYDNVQSIIVSVLDNLTYETDIFDTLTNITFNTTYSDDLVNTTYSITSATHSFEVNGTNTTIQAYLEQGINYTITGSADDVVTLTETFVPAANTYNHTFTFTPISLWLTFNESTTVIVTSLDNATTYTNITVYEKQSFFPTGKVTVAWNEVQVMEYLNELNPLKAYLTVISDANESMVEQRVIRVTGDGAELEEARVVAEKWSFDNSRYEIVYGRLTDESGEVILNLELDTEYKITAQKTGFNSVSSILTVRVDDTAKLNLALDSTSGGNSNIYSNCNGEIVENGTCITTVQCNTVSCNIVATTTVSYDNGTVITTVETESSSTSVNFGTIVTTDMANITQTIVVNDGNSAEFNYIIADSQIEENVIDIWKRTQTDGEWGTIWIIGLAIIAAVIGGVIEKKVKQGTGIYVAGLVLFAFAMIIPIMALFGAIILITKIVLKIYLNARED